MSGKDGEEAQLERIKRKIREVDERIRVKTENKNIEMGKLSAHQIEKGTLESALAKPEVITATEKYKHAIIKLWFRILIIS